MQLEIITKDDLKQFKTELLNDIKEIVKPQKKAQEWLKSAEVRKMLNISPGTLKTSALTEHCGTQRLVG
jgi:hypothetical protein